MRSFNSIEFNKKKKFFLFCLIGNYGRWGHFANDHSLFENRVRHSIRNQYENRLAIYLLLSLSPSVDWGKIIIIIEPCTLSSVWKWSIIMRRQIIIFSVRNNDDHQRNRWTLLSHPWSMIDWSISMAYGCVCEARVCVCGIVCARCACVCFFFQRFQIQEHFTPKCQNILFYK